ncbi:YceD family protein [Bdellovibrio sp.]|uniref:YceD family protein n=1 Tax=Bdellovibrio sp. TaxID=28201 RepID=UPI0039E50AD1
MKINLTEIPEEGRAYHWNSQTAELNSVLADLIGKTLHEAEFFIKPLNSRDFELIGTIKTKLPEICSRCGIEIPFPVDEKFHEILIPKQNQPRGSKYSKVNHVSDLPEGGPEVSEYEGHHFDIGEYLHEVVGLAAPFNAAGPEDENGDCSICKIPVKGRSFSYDEKMPSEKPLNPFAVLKNIKTN